MLPLCHIACNNAIPSESERSCSALVAPIRSGSRICYALFKPTRTSISSWTTQGGTLWDVLESTPLERIQEDDLRWWFPQVIIDQRRRVGATRKDLYTGTSPLPLPLIRRPLESVVTNLV